MHYQQDRFLHHVLSLIMLIFILLCVLGCKKNEAADSSGSNKIVFYNWKDVTDYSILDDFQNETGIEVVLKEYETRDMCIAQLQTTPDLCDVLVLDTYNIPHLQQQKLIREFDSGKVPNLKFVNKNVKMRLADEGIRMPPYITGVNGFMINTKYVPEETDSWTVFQDKKYKNKIMLLDDFREAVSVALLISGLSINETILERFTHVRENALKIKNNGVGFGETFTNIDKILSGEKWIVQTYNGDFVYKAKDRKEMKFIFPKEGFIKWIETFALHSDAKNPEGAHQFVDFMLRPEIAARTATTFSYQTAVDGATRYMPEEIRKNKIINPSDDVLERGEMAKDLGEGTTEYQKIFNLMKQ